MSTSRTPQLTVEKPALLFEGRYYVAPTGSPRAQYDVTADGQRFLMLASAPADADGGRVRIIVVHNWPEELKNRAASDAR